VIAKRRAATGSPGDARPLPRACSREDVRGDTEVWIALLSMGCSPREYGINNPTVPESSPPDTGSPPIVDTGIDEVPVPTTAPPCGVGECADVVFVIDTSRSMSGIQSRLATSADGFFEALDGLDYHVGTVTMDPSPPTRAGLLRAALGERFVTPDVADPEAVFAEMVQLGSGGSSREAGVGAAHLLIFTKSDAAPNVDFRRDGVPLHLIFVTDEDDQTDEERLEQAIEDFGALDGGASAHSLVAYNFSRGARYLALTETLAGHTAPIETVAFDEFLDEVALRVIGP